MEDRGLLLKGEIDMKAKIKNWMDKPWTNGTYIKYCAVAYGLTTVLTALWVAFVKYQEHKRQKEIQKENQEEYEF